MLTAGLKDPLLLNAPAHVLGPAAAEVMRKGMEAAAAGAPALLAEELGDGASKDFHLGADLSAPAAQARNGGGEERHKVQRTPSERGRAHLKFS